MCERFFELLRLADTFLRLSDEGKVTHVLELHGRSLRAQLGTSVPLHTLPG